MGSVVDVANDLLPGGLVNGIVNRVTKWKAAKGTISGANVTKNGTTDGITTNGTTTTKPNLPTVTLDRTLTDLYRLADSSTPPPPLTFLFCGITSALPLTSTFPRNAKYLYQDTPLNQQPRSALTSSNSSVRRTVAKKYLSLILQRDAFLTGPSRVLLFPLDPGDKKSTDHDVAEAERTVGVLDEAQRPQLVLCTEGPGQVPAPPTRGDGTKETFVYKVVVDDLEKRDDLSHPLEVHWWLNSKEGLAKSGLPTPRSEILSVEGFAVEASSCCEECVAAVGGEGECHFVPLTCRGERGRWVQREEKRILDTIERRAVPFVFKNQQTFGGTGTWVVASDEDKQKLLAELKSTEGQDGALRRLLSQVTAENQHLGPANMVISEMVQNPVGDYGVTFMVTRSGSTIWLAASEQMTDGAGAWTGSRINYVRQNRLRNKFEALVARTAACVASHGYYGPVGIDVLETRTPGETPSATGEDTAYHIVDLNVRTSGSMALPLLEGHFAARGLSCASTFSTVFKGGRDEFIGRWMKEFEEGSMLIASWYEDQVEGESIADVIVGGEDEKALGELMRRVGESTEEVTF